ncbi:MAG: hypothetical protein ACTSVL_09850, partial [Promethearchaeota archaeon]
ISHLEKQLNELNTENNMLKANTTYLEQKIQKYLKNLKEAKEYQQKTLEEKLNLEIMVTEMQDEIQDLKAKLK